MAKIKIIYKPKQIYYYFRVKKLIKLKKIDQSFIENFFYYSRKSKDKAKGGLNDKVFRDYLALVFKTYRKYIVNEEYIKAKEIYNEWKIKHPKRLSDDSDVEENDWLYVIDECYPVKGDLFNSYYINCRYNSDKTRVFQVEKLYENGEITSKTEDYNSNGYDLQQCRFATQNEINTELERQLEVELLKNVRLIPHC